MQHTRLFAAALTALFVLVLTGCSDPDKKYVKVEGTITYKGEPVAKATVKFQTTTPDGESASGMTDENGKYLLTSTQASGGQRGVLPGDYGVLVQKRESAPPDPDQEAFDREEIDYNELQARQARKAAEASKNPPPPPPKSLIPEKYATPNTSVLKATVKPGKNDPFDFELVD